MVHVCGFQTPPPAKRRAKPRPGEPVNFIPPGKAPTREQDFQRTVEDALRHYGWLFRHLRNTVANPHGLPDLLCWRRERYLLIELKRDAKSAIRPTQATFREEAAQYGVPLHVMTPDDWDELIGLLQ